MMIFVQNYSKKEYFELLIFETRAMRRIGAKTNTSRTDGPSMVASLLTNHSIDLDKTYFYFIVKMKTVEGDLAIDFR